MLLSSVAPDIAVEKLTKPDISPTPTSIRNSTNDSMDCSSSPTNTSGSDVSNVDLSALLPSVKKDEPVSLPTQLFNMPDTATILQISQLIQAQQAAVAAQYQAQQRAHLQQQVLQQQQQQQAPVERKRSYPCTFQFCVICQKDVHSSKLPCHIRQCHVAKPMFQCPACDFTSTYSKNNVKSHMVSLHGLAGDPISYMDKYAAQVEEFMKLCFPNVRGRGRPMQGRSSPRPRTPLSPQQQHQQNAASRRTSLNATLRRQSMLQQQQQQHVQQQQEMILMAQQQQQALLAHGMVFPSYLHTAALRLGANVEAAASAAAAVKSEPTVKTENLESCENVDVGVVSSSASSIDEILQNIQCANTTSSCSSATSTTCHSITLRPGENLQPRYMTTDLQWTVLNEEQVRNTIFESLGRDLLDKVDLSTFDGLNNNIGSLLSEEQTTMVNDVRQQIQLQLFEIMFAVHRMDLSVLQPESVNLVAKIAPSLVDVQRFRLFEQSNANCSFNEAEQFVIALSKIERLEEKIAVMQHMSGFNKQAEKLTASLNNYSVAAKAIHDSADFRSLLQLVLIFGNMAAGDYNAGFVKGFRTSQLAEITSFVLPASRKSILAEIASLVQEKAPEVADVVSLASVLEAAFETSFTELSSEVLRIEEMNARAERELELGGPNQPLAEFLEVARTLTVSVKDLHSSVKEELYKLLNFMGEPLPRENEVFVPDFYFFQIHAFLLQLKQQFSQDSN